MCGRFTQMYTWQELHALYSIHDMPDRSNLEPRYNIAPMQEIDILLPVDGQQWLTRARWGLVPQWWKKDLRELPATFNARAETAAEKPMFRSAFKTRRCVIPASGFYEWSGPRAPGSRTKDFRRGFDGQPYASASSSARVPVVMLALCIAPMLATRLSGASVPPCACYFDLGQGELRRSCYQFSRSTIARSLELGQEQAQRAAWAAPGVTKVDNWIAVRP